MRVNTVFIVGIEFDFSKEPRIIQEIAALKGKCRLVGAGKGTHPDMDEFIDITQDRLLIDRILDILLIVLKYYFPFLLRFRHRKVLNRIAELKPDTVSTHHLESAFIVGKVAKAIVFNSHEYIPRMYDGSRAWRMTKGWLIRRTMPDVLKNTRVMYVESQAVVDGYQQKFDVLPEIAIVPNASRSHPKLTPVTVLEGSPIRLVHHGIASPGRGLEMIIDAARELGKGYRLSLYLVGTESNVRHLKEYAKDVTNVTFPEPVPFDKIIPVMNQYDIGLCMFRSANYHTLYTTVPNKFWEYLTARVVPLVWSQSAMKAVLDRYDVGFISPDNTVQSIVETIKKIDFSEINVQKQRIHDLQSTLTGEYLIDSVIQKYELSGDA